MNKKKILGYIETIGGILVVAGAMLWILKLPFVSYVYAAGAVLFAVARFVMGNVGEGMTLRRLYTLRSVGVLFLLASAYLMVAGHPVLVGGAYVTWFLPFLIFAVMEVYTSMRILHVTK